MKMISSERYALRQIHLAQISDDTLVKKIDTRKVKLNQWQESIEKSYEMQRKVFSLAEILQNQQLNQIMSTESYFASCKEIGKAIWSGIRGQSETNQYMSSNIFAEKIPSAYLLSELGFQLALAKLDTPVVEMQSQRAKTEHKHKAWMALTTLSSDDPIKKLKQAAENGFYGTQLYQELRLATQCIASMFAGGQEALAVEDNKSSHSVTNLLEILKNGLNSARDLYSNNPYFAHRTYQTLLMLTGNIEEIIDRYKNTANAEVFVAPFQELKKSLEELKGFSSGILSKAETEITAKSRVEANWGLMNENLTDEELAKYANFLQFIHHMEKSADAIRDLSNMGKDAKGVLDTLNKLYRSVLDSNQSIRVGHDLAGVSGAVIGGLASFLHSVTSDMSIASFWFNKVIGNVAVEKKQKALAENLMDTNLQKWINLAITEDNAMEHLKDSADLLLESIHLRSAPKKLTIAQIAQKTLFTMKDFIIKKVFRWKAEAQALDRYAGGSYTKNDTFKNPWFSYLFGGGLREARNVIKTTKKEIIASSDPNLQRIGKEEEHHKWYKYKIWAATAASEAVALGAAVTAAAIQGTSVLLMLSNPIVISSLVAIASLAVMAYSYSRVKYRVKYYHKILARRFELSRRLRMRHDISTLPNADVVRLRQLDTHLLPIVDEARKVYTSVVDYDKTLKSYFAEQNANDQSFIASTDEFSSFSASARVGYEQLDPNSLHNYEELIKYALEPSYSQPLWKNISKVKDHQEYQQGIQDQFLDLLAQANVEDQLTRNNLAIKGREKELTILRERQRLKQVRALYEAVDSLLQNRSISEGQYQEYQAELKKIATLKLFDNMINDTMSRNEGVEWQNTTTYKILGILADNNNDDQLRNIAKYLPIAEQVKLMNYFAQQQPIVKEKIASIWYEDAFNALNWLVQKKQNIVKQSDFQAFSKALLDTKTPEEYKEAAVTIVLKLAEARFSSWKIGSHSSSGEGKYIKELCQIPGVKNSTYNFLKKYFPRNYESYKQIIDDSTF